jgi:hypothetical protein
MVTSDESTKRFHKRQRISSRSVDVNDVDANDDDYQELLIYHRVLMMYLVELGLTEEDAFEKFAKLTGRPWAEKVLRYHRTLASSVADTRGASVIKGIGAAIPWYPGPGPEDHYWPKLRDLLANHPSRPMSHDDLVELDRSSSLVLASCQSPWKEQSSGRGLVVGYVQSGKTTNFTAVMAKAADMGYRLIIVLSGTTMSLRDQTQGRLDEQLFQPNDETFICHTELGGDIGRSTKWTAFLKHKQFRNCVVVKKNAERLEYLNRALDNLEGKNRPDVTDSQLPKNWLKECPILVIDDEGDQASLSPDCDPGNLTAVNEQIVRILNRPRVSYVAYTATPFANCFVNANYHENLFPRDFIIALPESTDYFGSRKLFGVDGIPEILAVSDVPEIEAAGYLSGIPSDVSHLRKAIEWFLIAATVRRLRNEGIQPHTTMFVNVSSSVALHFAYWQIVRDIVRELAHDIRRNDSGLRSALEEMWTEEVTFVDPTEYGYEVLSFDQIWGELDKTIELLGSLDGADHESDPDCAIVVDNSKSGRRLIYDDMVKRPVIAIGGNTLSRGLTLEGLVSSFFMRSSRTYDTLLQMGRWFGFRRGYEDLFRVYMSGEIRERFEFLARIEREVRDWIDVFAETGLSPMEFGPRIRLHPAMQITRAAMLRGAKKTRLDLSGSQPETSLFENTAEAATRHLGSAVRLASNVLSVGPGEISESAHIFRDVDVSVIRDFFDSDSGFRVIGHSYLSNDILGNYITAKVGRGELTAWNVAFRRIKGGQSVDLLPGVDATFSSRSRKPSAGEIIDIGSLAASSDRSIDLPRDWNGGVDMYRRDHPLLVVYVIDKDSEADERAIKFGRKNLGAVDHLIGVALFFPMSKHDDELGDFLEPGGRNPWDGVVDDFEPEPDPNLDEDGDAAEKDDDLLPSSS